MATLNQFSIYNQSIPAGNTFTSAKYIGYTNGNTPLEAPTALCLFVKGATTTLTVTLQVAYCPTNNAQQQQPLDSDFISYEAAYTQDTIKSIASLNGLWYRFAINNTGASANLTCNLGN